MFYNLAFSIVNNSFALIHFAEPPIKIQCDQDYRSSGFGSIALNSFER